MELVKNKIELILLLLLAFVIASRGIIPQSVIEPTILGVGLFYFVKDKRNNFISKYYSTLIIFLYMCCFLVFITSMFSAGKLDALKIVYNFFLLLVFIIIFNTSKRRVTTFIFFSALLTSIIAICELLHLIGIASFEKLFYLRGGVARAYGLMGNPNYQAYYSFVIFVLLYYSKIKFKSILLILVGLSIILTISRGVIFATSLFLLLNLLKLNSKAIIYLLLIFFVLIIGIKFLPDTVTSTITERFTKLDDDGGSGRGTIWKLGFEVWSSSVFYVIFGFGFNNFQNVMGIFGVDNTVHNSFLRVLYELGLSGFIIIYFFLFLLVRNVNIKTMREKSILFLALFVCWMSNDFFLLKETFFFISALSVLHLPKDNKLQLTSNPRRYDR